MAMTKQDFIALADALKKERPESNWDPNKMTQWELCVQSVADVCRNSNPRFDRARWMGYIAGTNGPSGGQVRHA